MNRVVVTGVGVVSPIGNNVPDFLKGLRRGVQTVRNVHFPDSNGHSVRAFQTQNYAPPKYAKILDPFIQFILSATEEALQDAGVNPAEMDRTRLGIAVSSSKGGLTTFERFFDRFQKRPSAIMGARIYANLLPNIAAQWIARHWKIYGAAKPVSAACATGLFAILEGIRMIEQDEVDYCIAGAGDASITRLISAGYKKMGVLSKSDMRPFDKRRDGFFIGEGAGIVILEKESQARTRGAKVYGEVKAYSYGFEHSHPYAFSASSDGLSRCLTALLEKSKISPSDIDYLNLHGTGTIQGDLYETLQIKSAFKSYAKKIAMSSTKSLVGHMIGASGAVEVIACLLAMRESFIPPTAELEKPDPACDLDYTPLKLREKKVSLSCSISIGFGGQLGAILLQK
jgi:3-oxoacyl-[acyl-carrier-protein] synthase II